MYHPSFDPRALQDARRSGPRLAVHRGTFSTGVGAWVGAAVLASGSVLAFASQSLWFGALLGALGLACVAYAAGELLQTVELYHTHLVWRRWGSVRGVAYADIRDIRSGVRGRNPNSSGHLFLDLALNDGTTISFTEMSRHNELSEHLARLLGDLAADAIPSGVTRASPTSDAPSAPVSAVAPRASERSGFMGWFMQPHVLGFWGLVVLALGVGSGVLLYNASSPPELAQLERHEGTVAAVIERRIQHLERTGFQTRLDGWIVRLTNGSEFFVGTPESFDDANSSSTSRTEAALPVGSRVVIHAEGAWAWQLVSGSNTLIDYAEMRSHMQRSHALTAMLSLVSLVLGSLMCWSALKRFWSSL